MSYCRIEAPYPDAESGDKRIIFPLDPKGDDAERDEYMIQLIPGRMLQVSPSDAAGQMLEGTIEQCTVEGSDAPFFRVKLAKELASTNVDTGSEGNADQARVFVGMANPTLFPYTSRHPVVVYLPKDAELRYSIWFGGQPMQSATA
ncbi:hypothetical protein JKF63_06073 [Porcisia hertigi]|uniref:Ecotin n=1 Tax=Porcisia hertigi TaxID=2761500 RepID=A0A836IYH5_9TRYP|nr:hypothetical protein JKF63_06073 [Porcisia hertigi]